MVDDKDKTFGHSGLWPGYRTNVTFYEKTGITVAVQTNRDGRLDLESLTNRIAAPGLQKKKVKEHLNGKFCLSLGILDRYF